jgi:hypothetical protein
MLLPPVVQALQRQTVTLCIEVHEVRVHARDRAFGVALRDAFDDCRVLFVLARRVARAARRDRRSANSATPAP